MKCWPLTLVCALLIVQNTDAADWKPPENPDPSAILEEAEGDTRAKRFDDALAKHIWYHRNALKIERAQYGVRLSFALHSWKDLAEQFEPAMVALKEERELAKTKVLKGEDAFASFHDYTAFNRVLKDEPATKTLFAEVEKQRPADAEKIYRLAEPELIRAKDYKSCGKYLKPTQDYGRLLTAFSLRNSLPMESHRRRFEENFTSGCATLVGLLVLNDRKDEAKEFADKAKQAWDDDAHRKVIDDALAGKLPEPRG